jgi:hypothetical protein
MQIQPPSSNNPANPLMKVAALTIDKKYVTTKPVSKARVQVTLNFKHSNDLRGVAKSTVGEEITVCFSLGIQRASLELRFYFDGFKATEPVDLEKIAYLAPLEIRDKVVRRASSNTQSDKGFSWRGAIKAKLDLSGPAGHVDAEGKASLGKTTKANETQQVSRTFSKNNISVTYGANIIHWEINADTGLTSPHVARPEFLEGDLFRGVSGNQRIDACHASWSENINPLVISGSVFTLMQHLLIENVRFLSNDGEEYNWKKIDQGHVGKLGIFSPAFTFMSHSHTKERLVRQIIRKHLVSQGMVTEGARVQICSAYT